MSGITGGGTTNKQTINAPWAAMEPYIGAGYQEAAKLYSKGPAQYTPWSQTANLNDVQRSAMQGVENYVQNPALQEAMAGAQGTVNNLLDPSQNPYARLTSGAQSALANQIASSNNLLDPSAGLNRLMYQGTNDPALQAAMNKGINSSTGLGDLIRNPIASKIAGKTAEAAKANILSNTLSNAFDLQNAMRMKAADTANTMNVNKAAMAGQLLSNANKYGTQATGLGMQYANPVLNAPTAMLGELSKIGAIQQAADQAQLTDATNRWNYQQNAPYDNLVKFRNLINPNPSWGVTNTTTSTPGNAGGIGQIAGMALGGIGGALAGGPAGAMMGAQIGGGVGSGIGSNFRM